MTSNNALIGIINDETVVNYFQNLYLCDFQQQKLEKEVQDGSCELLSKFVPLWFPTTINCRVSIMLMLWITFKICIFVTPNNYLVRWMSNWAVVNYFQNLYLCDSQQLGVPPTTECDRCELLSKFVSLWLPTTLDWLKYNYAKLWITFKICIFVTSNS